MVWESLPLAPLAPPAPSHATHPVQPSPPSPPRPKSPTHRHAPPTVHPYSIVNEGRSNWRQLMTDKVLPLVANQTTTDLSEIAMLINSVMWSQFGQEIVFKSEQTPLIMDPMSTITFGFAR